jgi:hypothetical protein
MDVRVFAGLAGEGGGAEVVGIDERRSFADDQALMSRGLLHDAVILFGSGWGARRGLW